MILFLEKKYRIYASITHSVVRILGVWGSGIIRYLVFFFFAKVNSWKKKPLIYNGFRPPRLQDPNTKHHPSLLQQNINTKAKPDQELSVISGES